jgi:tRNA-binding protein
VNEFIPAPVKPHVTIEALDALDIRVGTIERVEEVPRSDKLMKLTVNFGDHARRILAGIKKERANPQELEGRQALFVVNLEPRKMAGELSEGMLFRYRLRRRRYSGTRSPGAARAEWHLRGIAAHWRTARRKSASRP